jgi:hypothetical protein
MSINENWNIRSRSHTCQHTGEPFTDGETFYTALFEDEKTGELMRRDYAAGSWDAVRGELHPFSFWKSLYEAPKHEVKVEVTEKEGAENLLRRLIEEDSIGTENTRYILAVMLERKRVLKQTATRDTDDAHFLIYEHPKSGEVYIIRDPELRLDQVEAVQREVSILLGYGGPHAPASSAEAVAEEAAVAAEEEPVPAEEEAAPVEEECSPAEVEQAHTN